MDKSSTDKRQGSPSHHSRYRSPRSYSSVIANPHKKHHILSKSSYDNAIEINDQEQFSSAQKSQLHSLLLTNYVVKFQTSKQIFHKFIKYVPISSITEIEFTNPKMASSSSQLITTWHNQYVTSAVSKFSEKQFCGTDAVTNHHYHEMHHFCQ